MSTKKVVTPGEMIAVEPKKGGEHVFAKDGKWYSDAFGLVDEWNGVVKVVPFHERYIPKSGDLVVGVVSGEKATGYTIDINTFTESYVQKRELREPLRVGTVVACRVDQVSELREAALSDTRPFFGGELMEVSPYVAPLLLANNALLLETLKRLTNSTILAGKNGWLWAKGGQTGWLAEALTKIDLQLSIDENKTLLEKSAALFHTKNSINVIPGAVNNS